MLGQRLPPPTLQPESPPMRYLFFLTVILAALNACTAGLAADGVVSTYLDETCDPYYVGRDFPKLTTPQWIGDEGVEAVVVLAIDDMRDTAKYEAYLRPILERLKKIDGRAPVSIMTCKADPADPQLQSWLEEGLSIECHTADHPCPLLQGGDFLKAKSTYERCIGQMNQIPGNKPVAFRMPCCDSLNTPSPRFWKEIFDKTTADGNYLQIDTSVFNITTSKDQDLPRELVLEADGKERFRKYLPFKSFVNTIEDYPYPYIIGGTCWEFPCIVPSDWEAQNILKPNNPKTVEDMKAALDAVVIKQGTFNLVFHPHGWIRNDQIVELIDHAVAKHGSKVKFLTFREAIDCINHNLLQGHALRNADGSRSNVRLLDLNGDGKLEVVTGQSDEKPRLPLAHRLPDGVPVEQGKDTGVRLVDVNEDGFDDVIFSNGERYSLHLWKNESEGWAIKVIEGVRGKSGGLGPVIPMIVRPDGTNNGAWFHSRSMWVQNEDTNRKPDLVDRLSFDKMLEANVE
jgi:Polysaccharide deacetylase